MADFASLGIGSAGQYYKTNAGGTAAGWETDLLTVYMDDLQNYKETSPTRNQNVIYDGSNYVNSNNGTFNEKTGYWYAGPSDTVGTGLFSTVVESHVDAIVDINHATQGHGRRFANSTTTADMGLSQTTSFYQRRWNLRMQATVGIPSSNSNTRVWIGFSSSSTNPTTDEALPSLSGFFYGIPRVGAGTPTDTNFMIIHNDGTSATSVFDDGILVRPSTGSNTTILNVEIVMSATDVKVYGALNSNAMSLLQTITTRIPATTTVLYPFCIAQRGGGSGKQFDIYKWMVGTV